MIHKAIFALRFIVALLIVLVSRIVGIDQLRPRRVLPVNRSGRVRTTRHNAAYGVNLATVRDWHKISTTSSLNSFFNSIFEDSLFVARETNLMQNLVTVYTGTGLAVRKMPIYPQLSATIVAEGTDFSNATEWTKSSKMTLTPQIAKVQTIITQSQIDTDPQDTKRDVAREQGGAIATKIDTDLVTLMASFTTDKGTSGQPASISRTAAALAVLRNAKARGPFSAVYHPYGWHDIWTQLGQPAATYDMLGNVANMALQDYFVGSFIGARWYISANIAVNATPDAVSGVFNMEALALDMRQEASQAVDEDPSVAGFGYEINLEAWYGTAVRRSEFGAKITHDATEPT